LPRLLARLTLGLAMLTIGQYTISSAQSADFSENRGLFSPADYKFAVAAAQGGAFEVALGNLAQKSTDLSVKEFGQKMVDDHGKAGRQLADLAGRKDATLPAGPSEAHQKEVDRLGLLTGPDFDRAYVALMVRAHKTDLKAFKHAAEDAHDADLKAFAAGMVPIVQDHLSMAETLDGNLKSGVSMNQ
jgi:putative membrane protein